MKRLLLIDANSLIHRTYHALPPLTNKKGEPTGSLYGLSSVLIKIITQFNPEYAAALFDHPEPTFRSKEYKEYKAHRPKADDELISQIIKAPDLFKAFSIHTIDKAGYEADDLIGTFAEIFKKEPDLVVTILTGDLDALQLVDDGKVIVETFKKGISETIKYNDEEIKKKLGVSSDQVVDYKALVGDPSDNIPGVSSIGPKTASAILSEYGSLENFLKTGQKHKKYKHIKENEDKALLSQKLATIVRDIPVKVSLDELVFDPKTDDIVKFFNEQNFETLINRLQPSTAKKQQMETSKSPTESVIVLDEKTTEDDLSANQMKVGFGLKNLYKKHPFTAPYTDLQIGFLLLGESYDTWEECSKDLFGEELSLKDGAAKAYTTLRDQIKDQGLEYILTEVEMPLIPVLAQIEERGILTDSKQLSDLKKTLSKEVEKLNNSITKEIGREININSPKQLLEYFNKDLGLSLKSTAAEKLEAIQDKHPIVEQILLYREFFKLETTYVNAFKDLIQSDGRIHPTFMQLGAATGRLSCQKPNLQNIPQESKWANDIRNIFVAPPKHTLVSFDYSQIELRILASVVDDKNMITAFKNGEDIHRLTAHRIFDVPQEDVTAPQRRTAKTLNFGIVYGMGPRAFARQSGVSQDKAKEFIKKYFEEFSAIKKWQDGIVRDARTSGKVINMNGRMRKLPSIHSPAPYLAAEAERMAINMPLQSVAADIIKLAMIEVQKTIQQNNWGEDVNLILSIHDELVFEISDTKKETIVPVLKEQMEGVYKLDVPLVVDVLQGKQWGEIK